MLGCRAAVARRRRGQGEGDDMCTEPSFDRLLSAVSAIRDITERKRAEDERAEVYREQAARAEAEADKTRLALDTLERNARAQVQLIEDLLDVSRIITGKMQIDVRAVDLVRVVETAIEVVRTAPSPSARGRHRAGDRPALPAPRLRPVPAGRQQHHPRPRRPCRSSGTWSSCTAARSRPAAPAFTRARRSP
jgi:hypothetical protein